MDLRHTDTGQNIERLKAVTMVILRSPWFSSNNGLVAMWEGTRETKYWGGQKKKEEI